MGGPLRAAEGATVLDLWVVPGAARTEIRGVHGDALRLRVAAPAAGGAANRVVESFLAGLLASRVSIVRGARSRRKQVRIESADLAAIASRLGLGPT